MIKMTPVRKKMTIIRDMVVKENKDLKSILKLHGWTLDVWCNQIYLVTTLSVDPSIMIMSYEETVPLSMEEITKTVIRSVQLEIDRRTLVDL
jgi:hypothetical protein